MKIKKTLLSLGTIGTILAPVVSVVACGEEEATEEVTLYDAEGNVVETEGAVEGENTKAVGDGSGLTYETKDANVDGSYYKDETGTLYADLPDGALVGENAKAVGDGSGLTYETKDANVDGSYYKDETGTLYADLPDGALVDVENTPASGSGASAIPAVGDGSGHTYEEVAEGTYYVDDSDVVYEALPENATADEVQTPAVGDGSGHTYEEVKTGTYYVDDNGDVYEDLPSGATPDVVQTPAVGDGSGNTYYTSDPTEETDDKNA